MMSQLSRRSAQVAIAVTAMVIIGAVLVGLKLSAPVVPSAIKKQLSFVVLYPGGDGFSVKQGSWKYDSSLGLLTYLVADKGAGVTLTISEQASPPEFSEVPGTLDTLTGKLNTYADFDSIDGHAYLTRPAELKGGQSALMNTKGTLMFAKPSKSLADPEWRKFFNALQVVQ